jgi:tRNA-modifying protein YgfZ
MSAADVVDLRTSLGAAAIARDVVRVAGPDAVAYLQGQLSQDVAVLPVGGSAWSFLLQPTGKVEAWLRVTRLADDELVLDVDRGYGDAVLARLRRFLLRTKADIDPLGWQAVAVRGPGAAAVGARVTPGAGADTVAAPAGWPGVEGVDLLGPGVTAPADVPTVDLAAIEALRIRAGVPAMGAELTDATIPAEAGPWVVGASVSFTKGCFTGQELVARIESRGGHVPRRLRGVMVPATPAQPVEPGATVVVDGDEVGRVTSVAPDPGRGIVALAIVGRAVEPPAAAELTTAGGPLPATVVDLPIEG